MGQTSKYRYTDVFRASAVLMLEAAGYTGNGGGRKGALMTVAKELKMPHSTLRGWYLREKNPPPAELKREKKIDFVVALEQELGHILNEMGIKRQDATYSQLATAAGIFFDKRQLLTGGPTENIDQRIVKFVFSDENDRNRG